MFRSITVPKNKLPKYTNEGFKNSIFSYFFFQSSKKKKIGFCDKIVNALN